MGLLSTTHISALETSQATYLTEVTKSQTVLNTLYGTGTEHPATVHSAWKHLWDLNQDLKKCVLDAQAILMSNDDEFGEWKF